MNEDALDATFELVDELVALGIPYLVGGSLATSSLFSACVRARWTTGTSTPGRRGWGWRSCSRSREHTPTRCPPSDPEPSRIGSMSLHLPTTFHWLVASLAGAGIMTLLPIVTGDAPRASEELILRAATGRASIRLGFDEHGEPEVRLRDSAGVERAVVEVGRGGPGDDDYEGRGVGLRLSDREGRAVVDLAQQEGPQHGDWGSLDLFEPSSESGGPVIRLGTHGVGMGSGGPPHLWLSNPGSDDYFSVGPDPFPTRPGPSSLELHLGRPTAQLRVVAPGAGKVGPPRLERRTAAGVEVVGWRR